MKNQLRYYIAILLLIGFSNSIQAQANNQQKETKALKAVTKHQSPYQLEGRFPIKRAIPDYPCNKSGRVVVSIVVNREGKVVKATPGATGSTTKAKCLLKACKKAALNTTWEVAPDAPEEQLGKIIYNFSLV